MWTSHLNNYDWQHNVKELHTDLTRLRSEGIEVDVVKEPLNIKIISHVTDVRYTFVFDQYVIGAHNKYWIYIPMDSNCPVRVLYVKDDRKES